MAAVMDDQTTVSTVQLLIYRLDKQDAVLEEIRDHVRRTNGRVTALELANAHSEGVAAARATTRNWTQWTITTLIAILAVVLTCGAVATGIIAL